MTPRLRTFLPTSAIWLLLIPLLAGCSLNRTATIAPSAASSPLCDDARTAAPADGIMQVIFPDTEQDSPVTVQQVREHNAARDAVCGPLTDAEIDYLIAKLEAGD